MAIDRQKYLLVFMARIDGDLDTLYRKTNKPFSKSGADKLGKQIAKDNGWRYFSKWPESSPQYHGNSETIVINNI
jgi:hypothetical protein